jgi:HAD superfamily, subfamily IIIB (Acid phosphatase)
MVHIVAVIAVGIALVIGAFSARAEPLANACTKAYAPQTLDITQPINLGQLKKQLYFYACSGTYDSDLNRVLAAARAYIEKRAAQVTKPAIVLDIDETSLSNLPIELIDDFGFIDGKDKEDLPCTLETGGKPKLNGPCGYGSWVGLARAEAIDGTLALYKAAKAHQAAVFFITGRHEGERAVTEKNLESVGYSAWDGLTLRPDDDNRTVIGYKSAAREKIAEQGYSIIVNVGDQHSDLAGGYAERAYKLPNPFYYIP